MIDRFTGRYPAFVIALASFPAYGHGFGERYLLPAPLWLYIASGGVTIVFSFAALGLFVRGIGIATTPRFNLLQLSLFRILRQPMVLVTSRVLSVTAFLVVAIAGIAGTQDSIANIAPTFVWIVWWIGFAFICAFLGNLWILVNPWKILFSWYQSLHHLLCGRRFAGLYRYPQPLGAWPAVLGFLAFAWLEISFTGASKPWVIGVLALTYSLLTVTGMLLFGKHAWTRNCEVFSVFFASLSRTAITEVKVKSNNLCQCCHSRNCHLNGTDYSLNCEECLELAPPSQVEWNLRFPGAGLTTPEYVSASQAAFVLLMLATVSFDGIQETTLWANFSFPLLTLTGNASVVGGGGLLVFALLIGGTYLLFSRLMLTAAGCNHYSAHEERSFVYSLIPIAVGYHFAHYALDLFIQGQLLIPLASDPLGLGWNLFGTRDFHPSAVMARPEAIWLSAIIAIVVGHFVALVASHALADQIFPDRASALRSQLVMVVLMVGYTMMSLWVVSQPLTLDSAAAP